MHFAALLVLSAASIAIASPAAHLKKRATCRGGQTVDDAQASDIELRIIGPSSDQIFSTQCCVWYDVLRDLPSKLWEHRECDDGVHSALRLTFHDAIGFSNSLTASGSFGGGGADGSIIEHADIEFESRGNRGLREIVEKERKIALAHNVSFADMIQFAGAAGITNCPGAPRLEFLAGRPFTSRPSPPGLLPNPADNVDVILGRMADAGFTADETVDLLASHTIADQHKLNPTIEGSPFDTTPTTFDSQFFVETLLKGVLYPGHIIGEAEVRSPLPGEFRMQSDFAIARDPRTSCRWQALAGDPALMRTAFRAAMTKLASLGHDRSTLVDCSSVIPTPPVDKSVPTLPGGKSLDDIEGSCAATPFPSLPIAPGPTPSVSPVSVQT